MPFGSGAIQPNCMLVCSGTLLSHSLMLVFYYRPQHAHLWNLSERKGQYPWVTFSRFVIHQNHYQPQPSPQALVILLFSVGSISSVFSWALTMTRVATFCTAAHRCILQTMLIKSTKPPANTSMNAHKGNKLPCCPTHLSYWQALLYFASYAQETHAWAMTKFGTLTLLLEMSPALLRQSFTPLTSHLSWD